MEQDLAVLQNISDTLKEKPTASQRLLAQNANMSLGMMNAVLARFAERGWIMLTNVNARKLAYALTPAGIKELTDRSKRFAKKTFELVNRYNQTLLNLVQQAKEEGKEAVCLYGESQIKFLIEYTCEKVGMEFRVVENENEVQGNVLCLVGENIEKDILSLNFNKNYIYMLEKLTE